MLLNEMILGPVHKVISWQLLTAEETSEKPDLEGRLVKTGPPAIASNGVPYLQMRWVRSPSTSEKDINIDAILCCIRCHGIMCSKVIY